MILVEIHYQLSRSSLGHKLHQWKLLLWLQDFEAARLYSCRSLCPAAIIVSFLDHSIGAQI